MHRSGTSALTAGLQATGLDLGRSPLLPGRPDNRRGFWELTEVVDFHERVLLEAGQTWDSLAASARWLPKDSSSAHYQTELHQILRENFGESPLWAVKDPRMCRLLEIWLPVLDGADLQSHFILLFRHPAEVAASLAARDGFSPEKSALLWLHHILDSERATRGRSRLFLQFDDLLDDASRVFRSLDESFGLDCFSATGLESARSHIDPSMRHHDHLSAGSKGDFGRFEGLVGELFHELQSCRFTSGEDAAKAIDQIHSAVQESLDTFDPLLAEQCRSLVSGRDRLRDFKLQATANQTDASLLREHQAQLEGFLSSVQAQLSNQEASRENLEDYLRRVEVTILDFQQEVASAREYSSDLESQLRSRNEDEEQARRFIAHMSDQMSDYQDQVEHLAGYVNRLERELESRTLHGAELEGYVHRLQSELERRQQHVRSLEDHIRRLQEEISAHKSQEEVTTDFTSKLEAELTSHRRHITELTEYIRKLEGKPRETRERIED